MRVRIYHFRKELELNQDRFLQSILAHAASVICGDMTVDARPVVHPINERYIEIHIALSREKCTARLDMLTDFLHVISSVAKIDINGDISARGTPAILAEAAQKKI